MFGNNNEKFHVVYGSKDRKWALLLYNLMGESKIMASYSDENKFNAQELIFSNENKVIFVGNSKIAKDQINGVVWKFNKFGIRYGWLGNSAIISIKNSRMNKDECQKFYKFVDETYEKINKIIEIGNQSPSLDPNIVAGVATLSLISMLGAGVIPLLVLPVTGAMLGGTIVKKSKKVNIKRKIGEFIEKGDGSYKEIVEKATKVFPERIEIMNAKWEIAIRLFIVDGLEQFMEG